MALARRDKEKKKMANGVKKRKYCEVHVGQIERLNQLFLCIASGSSASPLLWSVRGVDTVDDGVVVGHHWTIIF